MLILIKVQIMQSIIISKQIMLINIYNLEFLNKILVRLILKKLIVDFNVQKYLVKNLMKILIDIGQNLKIGMIIKSLKKIMKLKLNLDGL